MDIEILRSVCSKLPGVTEDVKWGHDLCFCVGGKMFCVVNLDPPHQFSFKVPDEEFDELSQSSGFQPAPYLARAKWVLCTDSSKLTTKNLRKYLHQSYEMIRSKIPKKQRTELGLD
jgi:predicted DNA-binding protein (MmcQ/YjbR family)